MSAWVRCLVGVVLVLVLGISVMGGPIQNPSFESLFQNWDGTKPPEYGWQIRTDWVTDGAYSMNLYSSTNTTFSGGSYVALYQDVDLTGIVSISFDCKLSAWAGGLPQTFEHFKASLLIGGSEYWSSASSGTYLDNTVGVDLPGVHRVEFRTQALESGTFSTSYWTQWDNFRTVPGPGAVSLLVLGGLAVLRRGRREVRRMGRANCDWQ